MNRNNTKEVLAIIHRARVALTRCEKLAMNLKRLPTRDITERPVAAETEPQRSRTGLAITGST